MHHSRNVAHTVRPAWRRRLLGPLGALALTLASCNHDPAPAYEWQAVQTRLPAGLFSVWGFSERDVYVVGADTRDGLGPTALHFDGEAWTRLDTGQTAGDLWWVHGVAPDSVFMGGSGGLMLRYNPQTHTTQRMPTPGTETIYGVWGLSTHDVWAVGGDPQAASGPTGVIWHFDGTAWQSVTPPDNAGASATFYKVWGSAANDVWVVGQNSVTLHWDGAAWHSLAVPTELQGRLFTVHGTRAQRYAVGGVGSGILLESTPAGDWRRVEIDGLPQLNGVYAPPDGGAIAVGIAGTVARRTENGTWRVVARTPNTAQDFHAVWVDPTGGIWAVGGQIAAAPTTDGMLYHFGLAVPGGAIRNEPGLLTCPTTPGSICTYAGMTDPGFNGDGLHRRESALYWPVDLEFSPQDQAYVLDWNNHRVRRVKSDDTFETVLGTEIPGDGDPLMADLRAPGALGTTVALNHPTDLLFQPDGQLLVCAWHNHKIRRVDVRTDMAEVMVGRGMGFAGDGALAASALLKQPSKFAYDSRGNLFVVDQGNLRVRRIGTEGVITTVAGNGTRGAGGDGGPPWLAQFSFQIGENPEPEGAIAIDTAHGDKIYVADTANHRVRMIDLAAATITTVVGTGAAGFAGDGGPATLAQISSPRDLEIGPDGLLYIADTGNHVVRTVDIASATPTIRTVVGVGGRYGFAGDRGPAAQALLQLPYGVAFDHAGNLYVADTFNNRIRRVQR